MQPYHKTLNFYILVPRVENLDQKNDVKEKELCSLDL